MISSLNRTSWPQRSKRWRVAVAALFLGLFGRFLAADGGALQPVYTNALSSDTATEPRAPWKVVSGNWQTGKEGLLGKGGVAVLDRQLGADWRIEYDAWSTDPRPCDLTLHIGDADAKPDGYHTAFAFGSYWNTRNFHGPPSGAPVQAKPADLVLITPGKRHRVVVEKTGALACMSIDGKKQFEATLSLENQRALEGKYMAFYVYSSGVFANLSVCSSETTAPAERPLEVAWHQDFNGVAVESPAVSGLEIRAGKGSATVRDVPNWLEGTDNREYWAEDHCLAVESSAGKPTTIARSFQSLDSGIVEFDLLSHDSGSEFSVALRDDAAKDCAVFRVRNDGSFWADGPEGARKLRDTVEYRNRFAPGRLRFESGRWYTFRVEFNPASGRFAVALIDTCSGYAGSVTLDTIERYLTLGRDLKFTVAPGSGSVNGLAIGFNRGRFLFDNLAVAGPIGTSRVNGKDIRSALRLLLNLPFEPRKDPLELKLFSIRHTANPRSEERKNIPMGDAWPQDYHKWPTPHAVESTVCMRSDNANSAELYRAFMLEAAQKYNNLLVRQAFLLERQQMLERTAHYLDRKPGRLLRAIAASGRQVAASELALADAYRAYADAYLDRLNADKLKTVFDPAADRLAETSREAEGLLDKCLRLIPEAALADRAEITPVPLPLAVEKPEWKGNGFFHRDGRPAYIFPEVGQIANPGIMRSLRCTPPLSRLGSGPHTINEKDGRKFVGNVLDNDCQRLMRHQPNGKLFIYSGIGSYGRWFLVPDWWYQENKTDPDIFGCDAQGRINPDRACPNDRKFNVYNPRVRQMLRDSHEELSAWVKRNAPDNVWMYMMGVEATDEDKLGWHEKSARAAFRGLLEKTYGTIEKLNRLWGANHARFEDVETGGLEELSGRGYEFRRFRQESYRDWRRLCRQGLRAHTPDLPVGADQQEPFGGPDFTMPLWFDDMVDIVGFHAYFEWKRKPGARWMDNMRKVFGTTLGNFEWGAPMNLGATFEETAYKNNGLQQAFHMMMWGQSVISIWYGEVDGWSEGGCWPESRLGLTVLRYSSTFIPLLRDRCERIGGMAITAPSVTPEIAILEPTSSGIRNKYGSPRDQMRYLSNELENAGFNYGFVVEELLMNGRQSLEGTQMLIIPRGGVALPVDLARLIVNWVKQGGVLISYGAPGIFDQYGRAQGSGQILETAFLGVKWEIRDSGPSQLMPTKDGTPFLSSGSCAGETNAVYEATLEKGRVVVIDDVSSDTSHRTSDLARTFVKPGCWSRDNRFDLCVRQAGNKLYLYVLNPSLEEVRTGNIELRGRVSRVVDRNLQRPVSVPVTQHDDRSIINLRLAPAEGALLECQTRH